MGDYTYDSFIKYVKFRMGQRTDLSSVDSEDLYGTWVNAAYKMLTSKNVIFGIKGFHKSFYFPELETADTSQSTVDGTAYIDVPSDCLVIREVEDTTNDRLLTPTSWREYKKYADRADTSAESEPTEWVRRGTYIYLHPTPDDAYTMTIDYRQRVTVDISGDSTTDIGNEWDEPILQLATYKGLMWMEEFDKAQIVKEEFKETVADILGIYFQEELGREKHLGLDPAYKRKQ